jgi:hypothetical protein
MIMSDTEVSVLDGGMQRWAELGLPLIHSSSPPKGALP